MRTAPSPTPRDPDFDRHRPAGLGPSREVARYYQRLVVNPFLAVLCACLTILASGRVEWSSRRHVHILAFTGLAAAYLLLQYHCLDCGATGMFHRWRDHICPRIHQRWNAPDSFRTRLFPTPTTQLVLWSLTLLVGGLLIVTAMNRGR